MKARRLWALLLVTAALVLLGRVSAPATNADSAAGGAPAPAALNDPQIIADREALILEAKRRRVRERPAAKDERLRSRATFGGLSGRRALDVLRQSHPAAVKPRTSLPLARGSEHVRRYLGDFTAIVDNDKGYDSLVSSRVPLVAKDEHGKRSPVDLELVPSGDDFLKPQNAVARLRLPRRLESGLRLPHAGVIVTPASTGTPRDATEVAEKLFYPEVDTDTDLLVQPLPSGVEVVYQLRSAASPEQHGLEFATTGVTELRVSRDGVAVEVLDDHEVVASVAPPMAVDADGEPVPVRYAIEGDRLVVDVAHHEGDWRYPILVDPYMTEEFPFQAGGSWTGWTSQLNGTSPFYQNGTGHLGPGIYTTIGPNATMVTGHNRAHVWKPNRPGLQIYAGSTWSDHSRVGSVWTIAGSGIYSPSLGWRSQVQDQTGFVDKLHSHCVNPCTETGSSDDAQFWHWLGAGQNYTFTSQQIAYTYLSDAVIHLHDRVSPVVNTVSDPLADGKWHHAGEDAKFTVSVAEVGSGLDYVQVDGAVSSGLSFFDRHHAQCGGGRDSPCPLGAPSSQLDSTFEYDVSELTEGVNTFRAIAFDLTGRLGMYTWTVKVDRSGPTIGLGGTLEGMAGRTLDATQTYSLNINATDGSSSTTANKRSGVKDIQVRVDGEKFHDTADQGCATDSCPMASSWTMDPRDHWPGERTITVKAFDQEDNSTTSTFKVTVPPVASLLKPKDGTRTSKWLPLQARADNGALNTVRFQYRRPFGAWVDIPMADLKDAQGQPISTLDRPVPTNAPRESAPLNWDAASTFKRPAPALSATEGQVEVRGRFNGGSGGVTKPVSAKLDQRGLSSDDATEEVGPGSVNLVTGNLAIQESDVSIAAFAQSLEVSRTFNSRDPSANPNGPFGPGWVISTPVPEAAAGYTALREKDEPIVGKSVELTTAEGATIRFASADDDFEPEAGYGHLKLTKPAPDEFRLVDTDGNTVIFKQLVASASEPYVPVDVRQPATQGAVATKVTIVYEPGNATRPTRPIRVSAPGPAGSICPGGDPTAQNSPGCRVLELVYATSTSATGTAEANWGRYLNRLDSVRFYARNPSTGQMESDLVASYQYDSTGRLRAAFDPRISPNLKRRYDYNASGQLSAVSSPGEQYWALNYTQLVDDPESGRLKSVARTGPQGTATTSMAYKVPLTGPAAPYQMGEADVARWAQQDQPLDATAVFPPDQVPASPPTSYTKATVHYLNHAGREVNTVLPGGHTTTTEYDGKGNVVRELTATNRARALLAGGSSAARSSELDTQRTYEDDGLEMVLELGPMHETRLADGSLVQARRRTSIQYDEGAPTPAPGQTAPHLPTTTTVSAQSATAVADTRITKTEYDWTLRQPTATIDDPTGLALTRRTMYDRTTGLVTESRMPRSPNNRDASTTLTYYYSSENQTEGGAECANRPEWWNLPCKTVPAAQPAATPERPQLPTVTYQYNRYQQVSTETERVGAGPERVTTTTYDAAGRKLTEDVTDSGRREGVAGAWGFNEGSGTSTADSSGNANTGTLSGPTWTPSGKVGKALTFDGADDQVTVHDSNTLDFSTAVTVEAWIKRNDTGPTWQTIAAKDWWPENYALFLHRDGYLHPVLTAGGTRQGWTTTPVVTTFGQWYHVAMTYDGQTVRVYVDGTQVFSASASLGALTLGSGPLRIGHNGSAAFNGAIDELRIYDRALTAAEVAADKNLPVAQAFGQPIPTATFGYSSTTGRPTTVSTTEGGTTRTVTTAYDNLGRPTSYTDADGNTSTTTYDLLDRPVTTNDGKGTQTRTYDATTGLLTSLADSAAGTFTATYGSDGQIVSKAYPNGMRADLTYDETGAPTDLSYIKTSNCSSGCTWFDEHVKESIHGQWLSRTSSLSGQTYSYDRVGRLTQVKDTPAGGGCTTRTYAYDANSNRTSRTTRAPGTGGACDTTSNGQVQASTYDAADRTTSSGFVYDPFGRTTTIPATHSGGGALQTTYYANDMVRSQTQDGVTKSWLLDPSLERHRASLPVSGGQEILHYADDSDSPAWTASLTNGTVTSWARNIEGIDGDLVAIQDSQSGLKLQLTNLHGDVVATASTSATATALLAKFESDEFGNPKQANPQRYSWLGGEQRRTELKSGVVQMGVRSYVPAMGRFTSPDPVPGASANAYDYAFQDPVNELDLDGRCPWCIPVLVRVGIAAAAKLGKAGARANKVIKRHAPAVKRGMRTGGTAATRAWKAFGHALYNFARTPLGRKVFGRGSAPINKNRWLRVGLSRHKGHEVFRVVLGGPGSPLPWHKHKILHVGRRL